MALLNRVVGGPIILVGIFLTARFSQGHLGSTIVEKPRGNQSKWDADSFITLNSGECDGEVKTTLNGRVHFNAGSGKYKGWFIPLKFWKRRQEGTKLVLTSLSRGEV
ncbi:hypothetical protein AVEN_145725-1 [Araneus ventricosus]|uniref:Uncharacterized protein n=1 Tax=Araneus ventricosus TaxID=182803 RepID=A0A4Y2MLK8_ARAVE|nr:hypothetical protein AVEN_145725-1 [Araneus ventricosus]